MLATAAWTHDPYLLLAIPGGTIIMGAARGIGMGLEEGVQRGIVKILSGSDPGPVSGRIYVKEMLRPDKIDLERPERDSEGQHSPNTL